jgi:DNA (cytosine-5)-methyltransferase 1
VADFYEFFAGGGMARAGLGPGWRCLFANDFDEAKAAAYARNWGAGEPKACPELFVGDVRKVTTSDLPGRADLAWASFPCQDLSLAGAGAGLGGARSGTFYPFWDVVRGLAAEGRAPKVIALENVLGTLTSHGGRDFEAICRTFAEAGYRYGALVINASLFVPQSRPRLFLVGVLQDMAVPAELLASGPVTPFHTPGLCKAIEGVSAAWKDNLVWWSLPAPLRRNRGFADLVEEAPTGVAWHSAAQTEALLDKMAPLNRRKVEDARVAGRRMVGCVYKRTRHDEHGLKVQRAEVRFDDVAGCLRTPAGGSSRQTVLVVDEDGIRSRLISARETARLMGLDDDYVLPPNYNEAYHLTGDGVVVDVVRHLAQHLLEPLLGLGEPAREAA